MTIKKNGVLSVSVPICLTPEFLAKIDKQRGMVPRATFIRHMMIEYFENEENKLISIDVNVKQEELNKIGEEENMITNNKTYIMRGWVSFPEGKTNNNVLIDKRGEFLSDLFNDFGVTLDCKVEDVMPKNYHFEVENDQSENKILFLRIQQGLIRGMEEKIISSYEVNIIEKKSGIVSISLTN